MKVDTPTLDTRDNQSVINHVWDLFITQEKTPSMDEGGDCMYQPPTGVDSPGCGVGCLLSPDVQRQWDVPDDVGHAQSVTGVHNNNIDLYLDTFNKDQLDFLTSIQRNHDSWTPDVTIDKRMDDLRFVAAKYDLVVPEVTS